MGVTMPYSGVQEEIDPRGPFGVTKALLERDLFTSSESLMPWFAREDE
jgi:hypothetical protein